MHKQTKAANKHEQFESIPEWLALNGSIVDRGEERKQINVRNKSKSATKSCELDCFRTTVNRNPGRDENVNAVFGGGRRIEDFFLEENP